MHLALLIPDWGQTIFFTNGVFEPDDDQRKQLQAREVTIERELVTEITGQNASAKLRDGRIIHLDGLFVAPRTKASSPLAEQLGCEFTISPFGPYIKTDETKETSVAGVFACGDAARAAGHITFAMADGAVAAVAAHRSLIFGKLA